MSGGERCWELDWWKWRRVREFLGDNPEGRAVVWTDDDLSKQVKAAFRYRYDAAKENSLLITCQSAPGLRPSETDRIQEFLQTHQA